MSGADLRARVIAAPIAVGRHVRTVWRFVQVLDPLHPVESLDCLYTSARVAAFTMIQPAGLADLWRLTRRVEERALPGAVVQCGVWRGGGAAVMARASRRSGRPLWLFDSFEGFPEAGPADGPGAGISPGAWPASVDDAREVMRRVGIDAARVSIVPGWFETTLPAAAPAIGPIALLSIDAVFYASVKVSLETFYDQIVPGGVVILDDYGYWPGCRRAVHEFLALRAATAQLESTATAARWFEKPRAS